ncbi:BrnT family toxin [Rhodospirillum rubrum]|uniref:BrnT family toxin n=1 Tax=Rhodospirillum rubrum TaxID=1085 RepID=UPI000229D792|nr:BrnT family toxin [Rhodospirillum rubrum]AEO48521.1 hypothetical protein F11_10275 [Rhodospirillum rubrum F11]MBK5954397.1 BrnT family toxin [Rhodospirillum rubrum]QXG78789.1 BrnT family toxin [Rhodospirillum rubrum]HAP99493.1 BrnT family toxin [Rhodospirillum rubrum]HCF16649.1 BrnT family toxin [Rhodospirillum rubrum]
MEFEWDESKNKTNIVKHGIDFEDAILIWNGVIATAQGKKIGNEDRFIAFGEVNSRVIAVVYTWRGTVCRIISARKAQTRERRTYYATLAGVAKNQGE